LKQGGARFSIAATRLKAHRTAASLAAVNAERTARKISSAKADDLPSDPICVVVTSNDKKL
jgi:hypothetical protein